VVTGGATDGSGTGDGGTGGASRATMALTHLDPRKVMERSTVFQQIFWMYAKLIMGLNDLKVKVSKVAP